MEGENVELSISNFDPHFVCSVYILYPIIKLIALTVNMVVATNYTMEY